MMQSVIMDYIQRPKSFIQIILYWEVKLTTTLHMPCVDASENVSFVVLGE